MAVRRARPPTNVHAQAAELAWAVPQVVAHRLARMAKAGAKPSPRDRKEFARMVAEKQAAFGESWQAMAQQALRSQQSLARALARAATSPLAPHRKAAVNPLALQLQMQQAAMAIWGKGLAPVHRRAVANAKRLSRIKR
ncbi:MAG: polyhydroxyalkanoate granule-associated phasin [Caldimonas sp.]